MGIFVPPLRESNGSIALGTIFGIVQSLAPESENCTILERSICHVCAFTCYMCRNCDSASPVRSQGDGDSRTCGLEHGFTHVLHL